MSVIIIFVIVIVFALICVGGYFIYIYASQAKEEMFEMLVDFTLLDSDICVRNFNGDEYFSYEVSSGKIVIYMTRLGIDPIVFKSAKVVPIGAIDPVVSFDVQIDPSGENKLILSLTSSEGPLTIKPTCFDTEGTNIQIGIVSIITGLDFGPGTISEHN